MTTSPHHPTAHHPTTHHPTADLAVRTVPSPLGSLLLVADGDALAGLYYPDHRPAPRLGPTRADPGALPAAVEQLEQWFAGERTAFDLPLALRGTAFQRTVWHALAAIPPGTTVGYGELAQRVGRPGAARAVGHAVARNPVSIVLPCHRVVGARGALTGYAGGVERKRSLLDHERRLVAA